MQTFGRLGAVRAHLGMLLWAVIVGLTFPAVGLMTAGLPPLLVTAVRFALAALVLLPVVIRHGNVRPTLAGMGLYASMGLVIAGFFAAMFWAAHRSSPLTLSALYTSVPVLAYSIGRSVGVERRDGRLLSILLVGAAGALGLSAAGAGPGLAHMRFGTGELGFFVGCVGSALYPVLTKWGLQRGWLSTNAAVRTFWSLLSGSVLLALLGIGTESPERLGAFTWFDALLLVYLGVAASGLTFWLVQRAAAVLSPAGVTAYSYLVPFVSFGVLVANGAPRAWIWAPSAALVVAALILLLRRDRKRVSAV